MQDFADALQRKADHIGEGTVHIFDDAPVVVLSGIGTGFVQRVDGLQIAADFPVIQRMKSHEGRLGKAHRGSAGEMDDNTGDHFVGGSGKFLQHPEGIRMIGRLSEKTPVFPDNGVGGDHDVVRKIRGNGACFAHGVLQSEIRGGKGMIFDFFGAGYEAVHRIPGFQQELFAARGGGCEDDPQAGLKRMAVIRDTRGAADAVQPFLHGPGGTGPVADIRDHAPDDGDEGGDTGAEQADGNPASCVVADAVGHQKSRTETDRNL